MAAAAERLRNAPLAVATSRLVLETWPVSLACPESFELGNGVSGTCIELEPGGYGYYARAAFELPRYVSATGAVAGSGEPLPLAFDLLVEPIPQGEDYRLSVGSAHAGVTQGDGSWRLNGDVYTDGAGNTTGALLRLYTSTEAWSLQLASLEFAVEGVPAAYARIERATGAGMIRLGGTVVANVQVTNGCVSVDFVDPAKSDEQTCQW